MRNQCAATDWKLKNTSGLDSTQPPNRTTKHLRRAFVRKRVRGTSQVNLLAKSTCWPDAFWGHSKSLGKAGDWGASCCNCIPAAIKRSSAKKRADRTTVRGWGCSVWSPPPKATTRLG